MKSVSRISEHLREQEDALQAENDWKFVAMIIDRCFLWIFVIVCTVGTTVLFVQPLGTPTYK
jgi:uncharacterized membrane-anchored protein